MPVAILVPTMHAFGTCRRTLSVHADRFESGAEVLKETVCSVYITVNMAQLSSAQKRTDGRMDGWMVHNAQPHRNREPPLAGADHN
jgi:hypothetical protein